MLKFFLKVLVVFAIGLGIYWWFHPEDRPAIDLSAIPAIPYQQVSDAVVGAVADSVADTVSDKIDEALTPEVDAPVAPETPLEPSGAGIPVAFQLAVPFTSQAPTGNWDMPYQESCEEVASYMVAMYYAGVPAGQIESEVANTAILAMVADETAYLGFYLDTTAQETARWIEHYFDLKTTIIENPTVDQLKAEIAAGHPVLVPTAGRELGNPFYSGDGPVYHFLVLKGYMDGSFITNDSGTRHGESYVYSEQTIMDAMGDWNDGDPANGAKRVIIATP
ncbi:MAG: C39 family peptidase, partial [Patescibacteria group bacterium]